MTSQQEAAIKKAKKEMIEHVLQEQDVTTGKEPLTREEVGILVEEYMYYRFEEKDGHAEACRKTINCAYRQEDIRFAPRAKVECIKAEQDKR